MSASWAEEYKRFSQKTRFLPQLAAFLISIFSVLSVYEIAHGIYFEFFYLENPPLISQFKRFWEESGILYSLIFQLSIAVIFTFRFVLQFFESTKIFWLNRILWIVGFIILISYWQMSKPPSEMPKYIYVNSWEIFRHASPILSWLGIWYLVLSPLRQIVISAAALIKSR